MPTDSRGRTYFRKLFFKKVTSSRETFPLAEGDIALDEDDGKLYRGDGSTVGGILIQSTAGISLTDISSATTAPSGGGSLVYNNTNGQITYTPPDLSGFAGSVDAFKTISIAGQDSVVADSSTDTLTLVAGSNMTITTNAGGDSITFASSGGGGSQNLFSTIASAGQNNIVADGPTDTLYIEAGSGISIATDENTDTLTITATGGGGGGLSNVVEDTTPQLGGDLDTNGNKITFADSVNAEFGDSGDLKIFHNGGHSIVRETGTGSLYLQSDNNVILSTDSGTKKMIQGVGSGEVNLYYNDILKLSTSTSGVAIVDELHTEGATPHLTLKRTDNANVPTVRFKGSGGVIGASIDFQGTSGTSNELAFQTYNGVSLAERFRVGHTGVTIAGTLNGHTIPAGAGTMALTSDITGIANVVEDTTPQLGGDLDAQAFNITTTGKILFANMYSAEADLPNATTYHGMFAHVHATGAGYFAHGGNWIKLANDSQLANSSNWDTAYGWGDHSGLYLPIGGGTLGGSLTVTGDFTVNGTTTTINTTELTVSDNIITLNNDETGTPSQNAGITVERGTSSNVDIRWNETTDKWEFTNDGTTYSDIGSGGLANVVEDTSPQLGGNLDVNGHGLISIGEIDITAGGVVDINANAGNVDISAVGGNVTLSGDTSDMTFTNTGTGIFSFGGDIKAKASTGADLTLQTSATTLSASDVVGKIDFQAPDDSAGSSALLVSGGITLEATGASTSSKLYNKMVFRNSNASLINQTAMTLEQNGSLTILGDLHSTGASGNQFDIKNTVNNGSMHFQGVDNGVDIVALSLNFAESGRAVFNGTAYFSQGVVEDFATLTGATGTVVHDCNNGHIFYHTGVAANFTANFTNLDLLQEKATNLAIIITQGNTGYIPSAVQIGGAAQTIIWNGNSTPSATDNGTDTFSFTILNDGGTYVVLGQMVSFGGV